MRRWPPRSSRSRTTVGYRAKRAVKRSASPQPVALSVPSPAVRAMICTVQPPNMRALSPTDSPAPATSLPLLQLHELLRLVPLWLLLAKRPLLCPWPSPQPMSLCAVVVRLVGGARSVGSGSGVSDGEDGGSDGGSGIRAGGSGSSIALAPVVSSPALRRSARRLRAGASGAAVPGVRASGRGAAAASPPPAAAPPPPAPGPGAGEGRAGQRSEGPDAMPGFARGPGDGGPSRGKRGRSASRGKRGRSAISAHFFSPASFTGPPTQSVTWT